ncbi:MAG: carbonic anhydrase family protein [Barrevirus sp.]|uniref:Cell surface-binding protein OPG105 n=1 Tax=Barrevirus sp. TaxID=2487763 RepID=A0A3G4ZS09_9VIRU|nr:MAG: carbonic anhydrase family protein [Barrevirus sp.]
MSVIHYQSPIALNICDNGILKLCQKIHLKGHNNGAIFNSDTKLFEIQDTIILEANNVKYQFEEYHFHMPGEHRVDGKIYASEVHYVFLELKDGKKKFASNHKCSDICGGTRVADANTTDNIFVIGRTIKNTQSVEQLENIQVHVPKDYFEYDGALTTGNDPVRWVVGDDPIRLNLDEIKKVTKTAKPIQPLDGRIILHTS